MKEFIVYIHTNLINNKKYVGITCQKPSQRWRNGKGYKNGSFAYAIKKYGWENFSHEILFDKLNREQACKKEIELILKYNTMDKSKGYNLCEGGNLTTGYHYTEEAKQKMSESRKDRHAGEKNPMYGKKGILAPAYGRHMTYEQRKKISESKKGKTTDYIKSLQKKINQYDLKGNFIKTWNSISEIEKCMDIKGTHISRVCLNKRKTTGNYIWKYYNMEKEKRLNV